MIRFLPCVFIVACFLAAHRADAQTFTVSAAQGQAQLGQDQSSYQPAVVHSSHAIPSWGKTADESYITIEFNPENRFRLLPLSEAEVTTGGESDSGSAWHRVVSLKFGTAQIDHNAGTAPTVHLDCETPTAVCGAVGTAYEVDATHGNYKVTSGHIAVSSEQEGALTMSYIEAGGDVTYNPGRQNTYSQGKFTGTVIIDGIRFHAVECNFTVAKLRDASSETAVRIDSGTLGGTRAGSYVMQDGKLTEVTGKAVAIHPQYLAAAQKEGALNVERAADRASGRTFGQDAALSRATAEATRLREELFNRKVIEETVKQTVQTVQQTSQQAGQAAAASRSAAQSSATGAAAASRSAAQSASSAAAAGRINH